MQKEGTLISLTEKQLTSAERKQFGDKKIFQTEQVVPQVDIQILSTNYIQERPVVRVELLNGTQPDSLQFIVDQEAPAEVTYTSIAPGIFEFILTTLPSMQMDVDWEDHHAIPAKNRSRIRPAQEGLAWRARAQEIAQIDQSEVVDLSDQDREAADLDQLEDDQSLVLGRVFREPGNEKTSPEVINLEVFCPFAQLGSSNENGPIQIIRQFSFAQGESEQLVPHPSSDTTTLPAGRFVDKTDSVIIRQNIFLPAKKFELTITVLDVKSQKRVSRVLSSEHIGPTV